MFWSIKGVMESFSSFNDKQALSFDRARTVFSNLLWTPATVARTDDDVVPTNDDDVPPVEPCPEPISDRPSLPFGSSSAANFPSGLVDADQGEADVVGIAASKLLVP